MQLRRHEFLISQCAGGKCAVCGKKIPPGVAVQLSSLSSVIRHQECMPLRDTRAISRREEADRDFDRGIPIKKW